MGPDIISNCRLSHNVSGIATYGRMRHASASSTCHWMASISSGATCSSKGGEQRECSQVSKNIVRVVYVEHVNACIGEHEDEDEGGRVIGLVRLT